MLHNFAMDHDDAIMYNCELVDVGISPPGLDGEDEGDGTNAEKRQWLFRKMIENRL